jgi:hypothetical protein
LVKKKKNDVTSALLKKEGKLKKEIKRAKKKRKNERKREEQVRPT